MTGQPIQLSEGLFLCVGSVVGLTLVATGMEAGDPSSLTAAAAVLIWLVAYQFLVRYFEPESVTRIVANSLTVCLVYGFSGRIINLLRRPDCGAVLLAWDRRLFGESPTVSLQTSVSPLMNEILSAGYLSYHGYLLWFLLHTLRLPSDKRNVFTRPLFTAFAIGFSLYFVMPAAGIAVTFANLFHQPIEGFWITAFTQNLVATMAAKYDSFPSMHVFVTGVMLAVDFVNYRHRFWIMLAPTIVMFISTVLLRMHFTVDLVVSVIMLIPFISLLWTGNGSDSSGSWA